MVDKFHSTESVNRSARVAGCVAWLVLLSMLGGGGFWGYREWQSRQAVKVEQEGNLKNLEWQFEEALEKRRMDEAEELIAQMQVLGSRQAWTDAARERVAQGRAEERGQEVAFLVLNARTALEAGRLTEAEQYCAEVEKLDPENPELSRIRSDIESGRREARKDLIVQAIEKDLSEENWQGAATRLEELESGYPEESRVSELRASLVLARQEWQERRDRAIGLVARARELDDGTYSEEAMRLLAEAVRLDPSESNRALYRKMAAYGKVMKVPGDFETITAAVKVAKANDRIMIGKGIFQESLRVPEGVTLEGGSSGETVIECPADVGAVVTVPKGGQKVRLVSLTLRHTGLVSDEERFPLVAVDGGEMEGENLTVVHASGHGLAVLNGGRLLLRNSRITDSGWDGVAATGEGSMVQLIGVTSEKNLQHGVDFWEGASGTVRDSILRGNGLNGFLSIQAPRAVQIINTKSLENREVGILVTGGVGVTIADCEVHENVLGGIFLGAEAKGIRWTGNQVEQNGEAGVVLEKGIEILTESNNEVMANKGRQIWREAVFPTDPGVEVGPPPPAPPLEKKETD